MEWMDHQGFMIKIPMDTTIILLVVSIPMNPVEDHYLLVCMMITEGDLIIFTRTPSFLDLCIVLVGLTWIVFHLIVREINHVHSVPHTTSMLMAERWIGIHLEKDSLWGLLVTCIEESLMDLESLGSVNLLV